MTEIGRLLAEQDSLLDQLGFARAGIPDRRVTAAVNNAITLVQDGPDRHHSWCSNCATALQNYVGLTPPQLEKQLRHIRLRHSCATE